MGNVDRACALDYVALSRANAIRDSMPRSVLLSSFVLLPAMAVALAACAPARNDMDPKPDASATDATQDAPRRKLNPSPRRAYTITLTIRNAPGPFGSVEGVAQYDVDNEDTCGQVNGSTGTPYRMTSNEPFSLRKVSESEYQGTIHADLIQDEDYYGKGICRWSLTEVRARLRATGDERETRFVPDMLAAQVLAQQSVVTYFRTAIYPRDAIIHGWANFGQVDRQKFAPKIRDEDLFTVTLSTFKAQP